MARDSTAGFVSDVLNTVGTVMDFLGGGGDAFKAAAKGIQRINAASQAQEIYDSALGQCATEGQIALMEAIGPDAFVDCLEFALDNEAETGGFLVDLTDHPEAIGEILEGAEEQISQLAEAMLNNDGIQVSDES